MGFEQRLRILIIDDDRTDREIYRQSLSHPMGLGFEFAESDSGAMGIKKAESWSPDCILLDYSLPDMDGLEVLTKLRASAQIHRYPIVMLTAYGGEALAVQAMKAGVMDYLPKRHAVGEWLSRAVGNAIEKFRMQRQIEDQRAALERSAYGYQVLLEAMPQMVWTASSQGAIQYANRRWMEYTAPGSETADRLTWDSLVHPDDRDKTWSAWNKAIKDECVFEIEHRLRRASDGEYRWHLVRAVPMRKGAPEATDWFGTCTEIEGQKRAEESALQRQKLESIGRLAGGIAHDFNNLLAVILGGASFASESLPKNHPVQAILGDVLSSSERAAQLTRQLLSYAGKANLFVERIEIGRLVHQTCEGMRASLPRNARLECPSGADLPAVETDLAQMRQVIVDLILNAAEALGGREGTISVITDVVDTSADGAGRHVAIEVRDTGCGMDEETQRRIFDPFFSTKATGRGLGLAGVQGFVRSNRGRIQVDSTPGAGTRFRVLLPAVVEVNAAVTSRD